MYTFRKFRKNAKALSPVVASIILIAVTVAVSIAVAAWMGGLTTGFMSTEQVSITNVQWTGSGANITLTVRNTGTTDVTLSSATVNGATATIASGTSLPKNQVTTVVVTASWVSGNSYQINLVSSKGNSFVYSAVAQ